MRTQDVKVGGKYWLDGQEIVHVIERIKPGDTTQANMQSGQLFTGYKGLRKKFKLNNGKIVYSNRLSVCNL